MDYPGKVEIIEKALSRSREIYTGPRIIKTDTRIQDAIVKGTLYVVGPAEVTLDGAAIEGDPGDKPLIVIDHPHACVTTANGTELIRRPGGNSYGIDLRRGELFLHEAVVAGVRIGVVVRGSSQFAIWQNDFRSLDIKDSSAVFVKGTHDGVVKANRFDLPNGNGCNGAVFAQPHTDIDNLEIEDNLFQGGGLFPVHIENRTPRRGIFGHVGKLKVWNNITVEPADYTSRGTYLIDGAENWEISSGWNTTVPVLSSDGELGEKSTFRWGIGDHSYRTADGTVLTDYEGPLEELVLRGQFHQPPTTVFKQGVRYFFSGFARNTGPQGQTMRERAIGPEL